MKLPTLSGTIKRRLLVNFRADPGVVQRLLPEPFRPKLQRGFAIVGVCLIRLEHERPRGVPEILGRAGEHAAHRIAIEWTDPSGIVQEGVFIHRRDTDSTIARLAGVRLFPAVSNAARFTVTDSRGHVELAVRSQDGLILVDVAGDEAEFLPHDSCFDSVTEVSSFFERGSIGYSPGSNGCLDAIELRVPDWKVGAFAVFRVRSSYFNDPTRFPPGSIEFDHALIMRDIRHEWRISEVGTQSATGAASALGIL